MTCSFARLLNAAFVFFLISTIATHSVSALEPVTLHVSNDLPVRSVTFSPKGDVLAAFRNGELSLWKTNVDSEAERLIKRIEIPDSKDWGMHASPIALSSDGTLAAVPIQGMAAGDGGQELFRVNALQVWDTTTGRALATLQSSSGESWLYANFAFLPNSHDLIIALDTSLEMWTPKTGARRAIAARESLEGLAIQHMRFLNGGKSLVTARADGRICLWDIEKPALKASRKVGTSLYFIDADGRGGGEVQLNLIVTSPDGNRAAVIDAVEPNNTTAFHLSLWDLEKGKMLRKLTGERGKVDLYSVDWSPDGKFVTWASYSLAAKRQELVVWSVKQNKELLRQAISKDVSVGAGITFSPNSQMIATPAVSLPDDGIVLLWDISKLTKDGEPKTESKNKPADK